MRVTNTPTQKKEEKIYPLKVYLDNDNAVIMTYTGIFHKSEFEIQDITCVLKKNYFYDKIEELKKTKSTSFETQNCSITISILNGNYKLTLSNYGISKEINEEDEYFTNWLLSLNLRKEPRFQTAIPISYQNSNSFGYGKIKDISAKGFKIELKEMINSDTPVWINVFDEEYPISNCSCSIKHIEYLNNSNTYGLEIIDIDSASKTNLQKLIERESKN